jgi:hypothetical protein
MPVPEAQAEAAKEEEEEPGMVEARASQTAGWRERP